MNYQNTNDQRWQHPGGKLLELGPESCSDKELLAILIGTGHKGKSALDIAEELFQRHLSLYSITNLILHFFARFYKHEADSHRRTPRETKMIIFYLRDLSVHFVTLC